MKKSNEALSIGGQGGGFLDEVSEPDVVPVEPPAPIQSQRRSTEDDLADTAFSLMKTDDISLINLYKNKCMVLEGSYYNIKITNPEDIKLAESIINIIK